MKPEFSEYINRLENLSKPLPDDKLTYAKKVLSYLEYGDLVTASMCGDGIAEYYFTGFDGIWMTGRATKETRLCYGSATADDIFPSNISHINRCHVDSFEYIDQNYMYRLRAALTKARKK